MKVTASDSSDSFVQQCMRILRCVAVIGWSGLYKDIGVLFMSMENWQLMETVACLLFSACFHIFSGASSIVGTIFFIQEHNFGGSQK